MTDATGTQGSAEALWSDLLSDEDLARLRRAKFARRIGIGARPAVIVIDAQNYMVGPPEGSTDEYPSACGVAAVHALQATHRLLSECRLLDVPIFYSRVEYRADGTDIGVYGRKRDLLRIDGWCLENTQGAKLSHLVDPKPSDIVITKKKPSAFFGTPLLALLIDRGVDTLIVTGGSTSNCVRATVVDSSSYNFRTLVPHDCVFDRFDICHRVALFDMDRQYADVVSSVDLIQEIRNLRVEVIRHD